MKIKRNFVKTVAVILAMLSLISTFLACGKDKTDNSEEQTTTFFQAAAEQSRENKEKK